MFTTVFVLWTLFSLISTIFDVAAEYTLLPVVFYSCLLCITATIKFKSLYLGILAMIASWVQLTGYGLGFIRGFIMRTLLAKPEGHSFDATFYK